MPARFLTAFCALFCWSGTIARADDSLAASTIVVYNAEIPESAALAKFYAQKRGISEDHLVALHCPVEEEISREHYDYLIATPLRRAFARNKWWTLRDEEEPERGVLSNSIKFVALIKGVPLKIRNEANYPGDRVGNSPADRNEASVDSEIATLGRYSREISNAINNPYFQSYRRISEFDAPAMLLVCRLDAPTTETVKRMIVESIATEKTGLWGRAYVDGAGHTDPGLGAGDKWLGEVYEQLHKVGIPVVYDEAPPIFPAGFPITDCALYYGWYAGAVAGPFAQPGFHFSPGAIAVHIHSFSAATLRDPNANWVGPLLMRGAAASLGNVYEPYLQLTANLDIFNDRLLHGFTLAESAYMSLRGLSWMSVVVGDPLYQPYATWVQIDSKRDAKASGSRNWKMYHDFALKNSDKPTAEYRTLARQIASRASNCPMLEDLGMMEAHDGKWQDAIGYFQQVRACYTKRDDILRVTLEEANAWVKLEDKKHALTILRNALRVVSESPTAELLRQKERELNPPPPSPSISPAKH
jgi:uncharacterized protein (TIGR03790 family)